ncbi:hypothetical protein PMIN01_11642 [Paraphaeosphaeria minitans]|uniref:Uncharacterized protein n=1 Tax=Paraphaeosphaeria minitans TaxID=565426 RepID=A0A9P6G8N2_9PLEO|nr:hypothetical protein PMIN01_11642 [Paraphaeosphaeria minitans]
MSHGAKKTLRFGICCMPIPNPTLPRLEVLLLNTSRSPRRRPLRTSARPTPLSHHTAKGPPSLHDDSPASMQRRRVRSSALIHLGNGLDRRPQTPTSIPDPPTLINANAAARDMDPYGVPRHRR